MSCELGADSTLSVDASARSSAGFTACNSGLCSSGVLGGAMPPGVGVRDSMREGFVLAYWCLSKRPWWLLSLSDDGICFGSVTRLEITLAMQTGLKKILRASTTEG